MIEKNEIWLVNDQVRYRRLFDEGVLIQQEQANALVLNDTGTAFLEHCDGQRNASQIISELSEIYEVDFETLKKDIGMFIEELAKRDIIRRIDS